MNADNSDGPPKHPGRASGQAPLPAQFSLSRSLGAMTCLAVSVGILRYTYFDVRKFGGGFYPTLCVLAAIALLVTAVALISPKTGAAAGAFIVKALAFFLGGI